jgi:Transposase DDE domain group 1
MSGALTGPEHHLMGEQPGGEASASPEVAVQTYAGTVHVEWDGGAPVTPLGQLPFFIGYLKEGGLFDGWVADCPLHLVSPNAPSKRDVLGTLLLSVLAGHWRYAHITTVRGDKVNPPLLGLRKVVCEDSVRRSLAKIEAGAGVAWLRQHLDYVTGPLLSEPWILDVDTSVVPLYGRQEGAVVGYNPIKRGRPSHVLHTYMMANLRLVLEVETAPGNRHTSKHAAPGLWDLMERLGPSRRPALLRGDADWGKEAVMHRAEQEALPYLFKLQMTKGVKQVLERAAPGGAAAPGAQRRACDARAGAVGPAHARPGRDRPTTGSLRIRRAGDLACRRAGDGDAALSRSRRCREYVRRTQEPVGLGRVYDP